MRSAQWFQAAHASFIKMLWPTDESERGASFVIWRLMLFQYTPWSIGVYLSTRCCCCCCRFPQSTQQMNDDEIKAKRSTLACARVHTQDQAWNKWQANVECVSVCMCVWNGKSEAAATVGGIVGSHTDRNKTTIQKKEIPSRKCPMIKYLFILLKYNRLQLFESMHGHLSFVSHLVHWLLVVFYVMFKCALEPFVVIWNVNKVNCEWGWPGFQLWTLQSPLTTYHRTRMIYESIHFWSCRISRMHRWRTTTWSRGILDNHEPMNLIRPRKEDIELPQRESYVCKRRK